MSRGITLELPDDVIDRLEQEAARARMSVEQKASDILSAAVADIRPLLSDREFWRRAAEIRAMTPRKLEDNSVSIIREWRDNDEPDR